ncbi:MAG: hypothetical protein MUF03_09395 [Rubrivivax sp.]|jgi:hypothetical protein|nr:hypothetical protein [Rubrivivax sp.]
MSASEEIAAAAAVLVVEHGLEYAAAKRKAARDLGRRSGRSGDLPTNEAVEDCVREHLALFCADTQPGELRALRELAATWMERLAEFRPHLGGAVWRGTATRRSAVLLDLYCDDPKALAVALVNRGLDYDVDARPGPRQEEVEVLTLHVPCRELGTPVPLVLSVLDLDAQRGALQPDARGRSWRGDLAALRRLLDAAEPPR